MSEENKKYLSIGMMSKLTGVHVKSLRYYDEIGILRPAYVDSHTKYRYYNQRQMVLVDMIQMCIELDIPLKKLPSFLSADKREINLVKLLEYGSRLANEKIKAIKEKQKMLKDFKWELDRMDSLSDSPQIYAIAEKTCWLEPCSTKQIPENFEKRIAVILSKIENAGMQAGYEWGCLSIWKNGELSKFIFSDVTGAAKGSPNVLYIPPLQYMCMKADKDSLSKAPELFGDMFALHDTVIAIETENYTWNYDYYNPFFELRYAGCPNLKLPKIQARTQKSCK